jgi:hypothetical protein
VLIASSGPAFYTISSMGSLFQTGRFVTCARLVLSDQRGRDCRIVRRWVSARTLPPWPWMSRRCWTPVVPTRRCCSGCRSAVQFAASYPDRVQALVLAGGLAKMTRPGEFDFETGPARVDEWASGIARVWSSGVMYGARACIDCPSRREPGVSTETPGFPSAAR